MGLGPHELELVIRLTEEGYLRRGSSIVEIGAQQLSNHFLRATDEIAHLARLLGVTSPHRLPSPTAPIYSATGMEALSEIAPRSDDFWRWLGFEYAAIDVDNSIGAIPLDLNFDQVPAEHIGRYDLVINAGTTEHVANQAQAMKIIHDLTKVDGVMVHALPAQGFHNHGIVNYNLKFFWMLSRSNVYRWVAMDFGASGQPRKIDPDIVAWLKASNPPAASRLENYTAEDCGIVVAMQKLVDIDFIPPLDVRTGEQVNVSILNQRYWTLFDPPRVEQLVLSRHRRRNAVVQAIGKLGQAKTRHFRADAIGTGIVRDSAWESLATEAASPWHAHHNAVVVAAVRQRPPPGMIFEVHGRNGCASAALETAGFQSTVIEGDERGREALFARGLTFVEGDFRAIDVKAASMPAIAAFGVVNGADDLAVFARALVPGGRLYLTIPARTHSRRQARAQAQAAGLEVEYATCFFRASGLSRILNPTGPGLPIANASAAQEVATVTSSGVIKSGAWCLVVARKPA